MPYWFARLDAAGRTSPSASRLPALHLPAAPGVAPFRVHAHLMVLAPAFRIAGFGSTVLPAAIRS